MTGKPENPPAFPHLSDAQLRAKIAKLEAEAAASDARCAPIASVNAISCRHHAAKMRAALTERTKPNG